MSRLLHPLASRQRLLMAMASSMGGVQTDSSRGDFVVAGLLGTAEQWDRFEIEWRRSAVEVEAAQSSMGGIEARRSRVLAGLIDTFGLTGIGSHVAGEEYERLSLEIQRSLTGGHPAEPYVLCFRHCILEAACEAAKLPPQETVSVVLDGQDALASRAPWLFEEIKGLEPAPVRERLGALGFEPKQHFAPLQAAEWLGHEVSSPARNGEARLDLCGPLPADDARRPRLLFKSFDRRAFRLLQRDWEERHIEWNRSFSRL
ncbi:MAG: hypothetical protein LAO07_01040 [Acidobacteriia bacterium]|nr:hypothetical protein [Terriglobia bacterium]